MKVFINCWFMLKIPPRATKRLLSVVLLIYTYLKNKSKKTIQLSRTVWKCQKEFFEQPQIARPISAQFPANRILSAMKTVRTDAVNLQYLQSNTCISLWFLCTLRCYPLLFSKVALHHNISRFRLKINSFGKKCFYLGSVTLHD